MLKQEQEVVMKIRSGNPFLDAFKYTMAITAGATVAGGLAAGSFKLAKKASKAITGKRAKDESEEKDAEEQPETIEMVLSDDEEEEDTVLILSDD